MYWVPNSTKKMVLEAGDQRYDLESKARFWEVIKTIPEQSTIPLALVKLGLLAYQLRPINSEVEVDYDELVQSSESRAIVPPKTLAAIRRLLADLQTDVEEKRKKQIGTLCEETELNRRIFDGDTEKAVIQASADEDTDDPSFLVVTSSGSYENLEQKKSAITNSASNPLASGKTITMRGGERITGKNPFADPDRLKDTKLHQGGG
jgi:hypothetical protein